MEGFGMTVRQAIFAVLEADSTLAGLASGGIHWRKAPQSSTPPMCIYAKSSGVRRWAFDGPPMHNEVWLIKGVGFIDDAEAIDERVQKIFDGAVLSVDNHIVLLKPMPEEDVSVEDQEYGETFDHVGTYYRIVTERAS